MKRKTLPYDFSTEKVTKYLDKPISSIFDKISGFSITPNLW